MKPGQKVAKSEITKEKIFSTALDLFKTKGYENTTMREIANTAGIALGSTYYHFRSKEDLINSFYEMLTSANEEYVDSQIKNTNNFSERFTGYINFLLQQFAPFQSMIAVLVKTGVDPTNPCSPFGQETIGLRTRAIKLVEKCIRGSDLKFDSSIEQRLPIFLWLYMMGIVFFWTFDRSENYKRTNLLLTNSLPLLVTLLKLGKLPLLKNIQNSAVKIMEQIWPLDSILEAKHG